MGWLSNKVIDNFVKLTKAVRSREISRHIKSGMLTVGANTYGINHLTIHSYKGSEAKVNIGKFCSIGPNLLIITGGIHPGDWVSTYPFRVKWNMEGKYHDGMPSTKGDIIIENDVWIGSGVTVLSGITIGSGAIIASNSMVTKSVAPYTVVGGNPAKPIKQRFDNDTVNALLKLKWWDMPDNEILKFVPLLSSNQVNDFLEAVKKAKA
ncbi:CatB-related O-acetyltransferase [Mucilaginibacter phyllosphaerae]|uniref:Acetyltransferase-like isoleucine patch superfamily enzyme n=1 Tax=Mucilaginibacter phyllosphaerae TaxID=1812349 RepID=A0A4Y8AG54_9SPHI|nr:CatB-related O-acetyltransferase [Mucilaginibacter phyllosphaerae]MBB3968632.1 acetyltransferase-like isoleucine patch superfamily enzyme [Mucilaginibacter phyllosphaerae]TEW67730.1 CatB-related O-acetyltransferase [Mucilaginibacter phyllosphaerae]GGH14822.1 acetyltransferase [Mucilaginibacter phyllosphaerae]